MRTEGPVLLAEFFGPHGGCVLYKAYYPQRGDDVAALVDLAVALPSNVRFLPVSPTVETIHDIRRMLPMFLADLNIVREPAAPRKLSDEAKEQAKETLLLLIKRTFERVPGLGVTPEQCLEKLQQQPDALTILLRMTDPEIMPPPEAQAGQEHMTRLPDYGPILILGRPDMIRDYHVENSEMHRLLDAAGYPNRFEFVGSADEILSSAEVVHDRKTRLRFRRKVRRKDDVGFIFRGRTPHGQTVVVIEGGTSLGTYAGVRVLLHPSQVVEETVEAAKTSDPNSPIDIGFRCELREEARDTPFPLTHEPRRLKVDILNPDDVSGFRWARRSAELLEPMLDAWDRPCKSEPCLVSARSDKHKTYMEWRCKRQLVVEGSPRGRVLPVEIRTRAYRISDQQVVRPSWKFGEVLDQVVEDLKKDRDRWRRRLGVWLVNSPDNSIVRGMDCDPTRETLRPVLLIGPTGAGKEFVTRLIARGWNGRVLPLDQVNVSDQQLRQDRNAYLDHAQDLLDKLAREWLDSGYQGMPFDQLFHTLSPVAVPDTLLNSEMFGIAGNIASDSTTAVGAFTVAGTGILFLDEMLELDPTLQSRFLVALQNAQVSPIGAHKAYGYLCRVVAATNKAHNAEQLWKLAESRGVRNDLVSRFSRRYEIPSLSDRAPEIVTGLMEMIRLELAQAAREKQLAGNGPGDVDAGAVRPHLRISRPAFEALISHHFADNFRGLKRLCDSLPAEMVTSFDRSFKGSSFKDIRDGSICLEHLRTLLGVDSEEVAESPAAGGRREEETDFYEFHFGDDLVDECDPAPTPEEWEELPAFGLNLHDIAPGRHEPYKKLYSSLLARIDRFASLRRHGINIFGEQVLSDSEFTDPGKLTTEKLVEFFETLDDECCGDLKELMRAVLEAFAGADAPSHNDLSRVFSRSYWREGTFPLRAFTSENFADQTGRDTITQDLNKRMMAVIDPLLEQLRAGEPRGGQRGRPRGLTQKTVLALLAGGWQ